MMPAQAGPSQSSIALSTSAGQSPTRERAYTNSNPPQTRWQAITSNRYGA